MVEARLDTTLAQIAIGSAGSLTEGSNDSPGWNGNDQDRLNIPDSVLLAAGTKLMPVTSSYQPKGERREARLGMPLA